MFYHVWFVIFIQFENGETEECTWIPIKSLMWVKGRTRGLSTVGYTELSGSILTQKEIFPNAAMGFNRRKFLVSTLVVCFYDNCLKLKKKYIYHPSLLP